ncbi:hypothetical protein E2320_012776, partial [Naja naja]
YFLYHKVFQAWRSYLLQQRAKKLTYRIAAAHGLAAMEGPQHTTPAGEGDSQLGSEVPAALGNEEGLEVLAPSCGFRALCRNAREASLKQVRRNLACQQHRIVLTSRFWACWRSRLEQKEDEQHRLLTLAAVSHHSRGLLQTSLRTWRQRACRERRQKLQCAKADQHRKAVVLSAAFQAWELFKDHQLWWSEMNRVAAGYHRETWTRRVFAQWLLRQHEQREGRAAEKVAMWCAERRVLSQFWGQWHRATLACLEEREGVTLASGHHRRQLLRATLYLWRENVWEVKRGRAKEAAAWHSHSEKLLRCSWRKWRQYQMQKSEKWKKMARAEGHYQQALLGRVMAAWKVGCQAQTVSALGSPRASAGCSIPKEHSVPPSPGGPEGERSQSGAAAVIPQTQSHCAGGRLRGLFLRWREASASSSQQKGQLITAAEHHRRQLLSRCLERWKQDHLSRIRAMLLQRQGEQLLARRLSAAAFASWKVQLADRWRERQQTVQALWHWSRSLQRKVSLGPVSTQPQLPQPTLEPTSAPPPGCPALSRLQVLGAWGGFVQEQLRKKGRMARAAESYQAELLHEGICRILRYVAAMKQQRGCLQAQQQLQVKLEPGWQARLSPHDGASGFGALPSLMMAGGGGASAWGRLFTPGWSLGSGTGVPARPAPPALCLQAACQRHHLVYRCAMMWKQKALSRKPSLARLGAPTKKHVTFEVPRPGPVPTGIPRGQASLPGVPRDYQAAGDSILTDL